MKNKFKIHSDEDVEEAQYRVSLKRDLRKYNIKFDNESKTEDLKRLHNALYDKINRGELN